MRNLIIYALLILLWLIAGKETTTVMAAIPEVKQQQGRYISGRITDAEDGEPIPGASVFFTNTTVGTATDTEGNYRLRIPGEGSYRLTISHIGYQTVVEDIEPGRASVVFDVALQIQELEEVKVSAGIRFRQRDINLFWSRILGKSPSGKTIRASNPETVYYYYNPETRILKVICREPLEIINYETGYHIQYLLDYFTHDYNTNITNWEYQSIFTELEPNNNQQKNNWGKNRNEVYQVSITKFIKSLYKNTLQNDGFVLTSYHKPDPATPGRADPFRQTAIINPNDFLTPDSIDNSKILNLPYNRIILISYGKPLKERDMENIPNALKLDSSKESIKWEQTNKGVFRNQLNGDMIRIFPDGTYTNRLYLSPMDVFNPLLLGLCMTLPIDYIPEVTNILPKNNENTTLLAYDINNIDGCFDRQLSTYPQEKIHLHTDRDSYVPGEKVWFKAYLTDSETHRYPTLSRYVYVELINQADSVLNRVMIKQTDNMFYGYIPLTEIVPEGNYTLCAYTRAMGNLGDDYFFKKNIRIESINGENRGKNNNGSKIVLSKLRIEDGTKSITNDENNKASDEDFDVSFFPEGGNLVEGVLCKVAFKALNSSGKYATISGKLIDENGSEITTVETLHAGMGLFVYTPLPGETIYLKCSNENGLEKRFKLPHPHPHAYTITASPRGNNLYIEEQHSLSHSEGGKREILNAKQRSENTPLYLLVHCRGILLHFSEWDKEKKGIVFAQDQLPAGVIQFVLFDSQMNPLSERLVFSKNNASERMVFRTDKANYQIRDYVSATLSFSDSSEIFLPSGHFSVSVTDDKDIAVDESTTILSSLLLSSELKGYIENPAYYLHDNPASNAALDLLMMTHGWRRYDIPKIIKNNPANPQISFQESQDISGSVKSTVLTKPVVNSEVIILLEDGGIEVATTDEKGIFTFRDIDIPDSTALFIQALSKSGSGNLQLVVDAETFPESQYALQNPLSRINAIDTEIKDESVGNIFVAKAEQRVKYEEDIWTIQLKEVEVSAPRIEKKDTPRLQFWANLHSDQTITRNDIEKYGFSGVSVAQTIRMLASGIREVRDVIYIRGSSRPPVVVIDGVMQSDVIEDRAKILKNFPLSEVESIDVFKGYGAAAFGMLGTDGVISITTKRGENSPFTEKTNHTVYTPLGYQKPVEFYAPKYETSAARQSPIPDYRTTIFWKPDVVISDSGEASFEFYTSDFPTTYSVVIEGLTAEGRIVRQVEKIKVSD